MYSYDMYRDSADLQALIAKAESGETEAARNGLHQFIQKHPSTLLAWKWLADVAENTKERSYAIRRAQLIAPGDPWVIEAKKHRRPPARRRRKPKPHTETEAESESASEIRASPVDETQSHGSYSSTDENVAAPSGAMQGGQLRWAIWVAAAMGVAGLALLARAWQLSSF